MLRSRLAAFATLFSFVAFAALLSLAAACGSDSVSPSSTTPPPTTTPPAISSIDVSPATADLAIGGTKALVATARSAAGAVLTGRTLTWTTSAAAVAAVDANGVVTAVAAGTATITVSGEGKSATAAITVKAPVIPVATVTVGPSLDTLEAYDPRTMAAVLRDSLHNVLTGRVVRWTSSNPAVATIDSVSGALLGLDRGTVTITATSETKSGTASRVIVIRYRSVAAGSMHVCDIASGGFVWCWGLNGNEGRIGDATLGVNAMSSVPRLVPNTGYTALRFTQLSSYGTHTCGVTTTSRAYCWGSNSWGTLGDGSSSSQSNVPVLVAGGLNFRQVSTGADHSCGVTTDDRAFCWGHNDGREFASATPAMSTTPVAVAPNMNFASISAGMAYSCGVTTSGAGYCWGSNGLGQTGDGQKISYGNTYQITPVAVATSSQFRSIDASHSFTCGLTTANQVLCWGSNGGKLGNGNTTDASTPVIAGNGISFSSVSAGNTHSCAVASDAALWCWGANGNGQLGVAAPAVATSPVRAAGSLLISEVSASGVSTGFGAHTCTISSDRLTTYCFGRNETGQLGNGTTSIPTAVNSTPTIVVGQKPLP